MQSYFKSSTLDKKNVKMPHTLDFVGIGLGWVWGK
jgi:hypothetical protein